MTQFGGQTFGVVVPRSIVEGAAVRVDEMVLVSEGEPEIVKIDVGVIFGYSL